MKKTLITETLNKIKYLNEYHFKATGSERGMHEENPVKFSEIGDKYSNTENDFPTFEEYRDEVIIDEDEPTKPEDEVGVPQEQPQQQAAAPEQQQAPAPEPAPAPVPEPAPAPEPMPEPAVADTNDLEIKLNDQIQKTQEVLNVVTQLQNSLGAIQGVNSKIDQVAQKVEDIANPSPEKQFDMISKNSYPYNIKLSDYWGWEDAEADKEAKEKEYVLTQADIDNYDPTKIKQSLNITEQTNISDLK